jgi:hypothetical protein
MPYAPNFTAERVSGRGSTGFRAKGYRISTGGCNPVQAETTSHTIFHGVEPTRPWPRPKTP